MRIVVERRDDGVELRVELFRAEYRGLEHLLRPNVAFRNQLCETKAVVVNVVGEHEPTFGAGRRNVKMPWTGNS